MSTSAFLLAIALLCVTVLAYILGILLLLTLYLVAVTAPGFWLVWRLRWPAWLVAPLAAAPASLIGALVVGPVGALSGLIAGGTMGAVAGLVLNSERGVPKVAA